MWTDDTTVSEVEAKGGVSHAESIASRVTEWSGEKGVQLKAEKCKEFRISFPKESLILLP